MIEKSEISPSTADWLEHLYGPVRRFGERVAEFFSPTSDAAKTDEYYEVNVELPGVADKDITVEVHDSVLTVKGEKRSSQESEGKNYFFSERTFGRFQRTFRLPQDSDENGVSARHQDGVLSIRIAKTKPTTTKARTIPVNHA